MFASGGIHTAAGVHRFGYDAVEAPASQRRQPVTRRRPEDRELTPRQRVALSSSTRDLERNFSIASWAIRKHLDYVSDFSFQADTGDDALDEAVEDLVAWWELPQNFDAAARLSRPDFTRMGEARATLDGDVFFNFLTDGKSQGIEGDRVVNPQQASGRPLDAGAVELPDGHRFEHGVQVNDFGRAVAFAVHKRTGVNGEGLEFERMLGAGFCYQHGYFTRFDQVRGISPLASACNPLRDVYEGFGYALAKAKVSQLFAMAVYRKAGDDLTGTATDVVEEDVDADGNPRPRYNVKLGGGPLFLDLEDGDEAKVLESATPSEQFQQFTNTMIGVGLKALDIPFSFYDESFTTYTGQRTAWIQYDISAARKRARNRAALAWKTARRLALFVRDGDLVLPRGFSFAKLLKGCNWISRGIPWIDPLKEITADVAAINAAQIGPESAARQRGGDVYKNIDERARVEEYAKKKGVTLSYQLPAPAPADDQAAAAEDAPPAKAPPPKKQPAGAK